MIKVLTVSPSVQLNIVLAWEPLRLTSRYLFLSPARCDISKRASFTTRVISALLSAQLANILVCDQQGKAKFGKHKRKWEDNMKMGRREQNAEGEELYWRRKTDAAGSWKVERWTFRNTLTL